MNKIHSTLEKSRFGRTLFNNRFVILAFFCSLTLCGLIAYCFDLVPFGNSTILRMDLYHQYGPLFAELYERLKGGESLIYSWVSGGGSSFLGNFYNYLSSPLSLLILLFGHENITEAISTMIFLKACFASSAFTYYLKKSLGKHNLTTTAFGVLYAFCGYFIAYYWNLMWLDAMVLLPIILYGIEKIIHKGKPLTYILALALTMFSNYYMSYMACLFSVIYFLFYFFANYEFSASLADFRLPSQKDKFYNKGAFYKIRTSRFLNSGITFAGASLAAAAVAAFALIPTYFILQSCSATSGTFPEEFSMYNTIFDFIANHLASVDPTIRSSGEDVLPNVYCGIITVMLVPLFYFTKSVKLREKISYTALLAVLFFSFNTNYLNYIWHGFHFPNDLPYRFSFMYCFIILVMAYKTLIRIREFKPKEIMGVGFGTVLFIIIIEELGSKNVTDKTVLVSLAFAVIYTVCLYFFTSKKYKTQAVSLFLLCCVLSEYAVASTDNYVMNQKKKDYTSDLPAFQQVKQVIDEDAGTDMYRMELTNLRTRMDPCWYNYNGVSTFSSMAYEKLSNLQQNIGMFGNYINSYTYNLQTPVYNAMFALDYIVNNSEQIVMNPDLFTQLYKKDKFTAYKNNYALPIAYYADGAVKDWNYTSSNPFEIQSNYFELATGVSDVFNHIDLFDINGVNVNPIENYEGLTSFFFDVSDPELDASITALVNPEKTQNLYLYVESTSISKLTVSVAGKELTQNIDGEYHIFDLGVCPAGEMITIDMPLGEDTESGYADFYLYGLDMDKFREGYKTLKSGAMDVEEFTDTKISGTFTAPDNGILYTSIPYDKGWKVTIDGKTVSETDIFALGEGLLAVYVGDGTHTVSFQYTPKGYHLSIMISVIGLLLIAAYALLSRKKCIRKQYMLFSPADEKKLTNEYTRRIVLEKEQIAEQERLRKEQEALIQLESEQNDDEDK